MSVDATAITTASVAAAAQKDDAFYPLYLFMCILSTQSLPRIHHQQQHLVPHIICVVCVLCFASLCIWRL